MIRYIQDILLILLVSFLMAGSCDRCEYIGFIAKSRSLGTNDVFSITPLKKVYKVGDTVRIKKVVNVIADLVDSSGNFTGKKLNLYDIGIRVFSTTPPNIGGAKKIIYYLETIKTHTSDGYYPAKRQFIDEYDAVIKKTGKYHLKQGEVRITGGYQYQYHDENKCIRYYHIHTLNFKDMKFEVVE